MTKDITGGCDCGGVRYALTPPLRDVSVCHCSICRRTHGGAAPYTSVPRAALTLLVDDTLTWYVDRNDRSRGFCNRCGGSLFWQVDGRDTVSVTAGTLDDRHTGLVTAIDIFCDSAADYEVLTPGVPHHAEGS